MCLFISYSTLNGELIKFPFLHAVYELKFWLAGKASLPTWMVQRDVAV